MSKKYINSKEVESALPTAYSHAVRAGNTIYVAGQIAFDKNGKVVGKGDIEAQATQVFENIKAILKEEGATMDDIVKFNVYWTDIKNRPGFHKVRAKYFKPGKLPASTGVIVKGLIDPDLLLEVECVAVVD